MLSRLLQSDEKPLLRIIQHLDLLSIINLSRVDSDLKHVLSNNTSYLIRKLQNYLVNFLHDFPKRSGDRDSIHFLCKIIFNHVNHVCYNISCIKDANQIKPIYIDLLLKSMELETTGFDVFPPVNVNGRRAARINHWYCFPTTKEGHFLFLINTTDEFGAYSNNPLYNHPFLCATIHNLSSQDGRCLYYCVKEDPICEWDALINDG